LATNERGGTGGESLPPPFLFVGVLRGVFPPRVCAVFFNCVFFRVGGLLLLLGRPKGTRRARAAGVHAGRPSGGLNSNPPGCFFPK